MLEPVRPLKFIILSKFPHSLERERGRERGREREKGARLDAAAGLPELRVVYGDLSISPIYVFKSTFSGRLRLHVEEEEEIFGVLSLVFWTITIIPLFKYIVFVIGADDNGEDSGGFLRGTFALYSLMCRRSKMGLLSTPQVAHEHLSALKPDPPTGETRTSSLIKEFFERHRSSRVLLLLTVLMATGMMIGDGVLTPTMSVLSAVSGVEVKISGLHEFSGPTGWVPLRPDHDLLARQHRWVGIYNIARWNPSVVQALSPHYIIKFFKITQKDGWMSLGGIVLCITGAEAMFADLGHFSKTSIRLAFMGVVYPCLVLAYMGEAAYLTKHKEDLRRSFYKSIPEPIFWPVFIIATLATAVGSQAMISATFSIVSQCRAFRCFPRVKVVHTSGEVHGQIYIPEVNWALMVICLAVAVGFKDTTLIGNAYGLAVISVMVITTVLMLLVITTVWRRSLLAALCFAAVFGSVEMVYLSASLAKVPHSGWFPLALSLTVVAVMAAWHYGTWKKESFELQNKVSLDSILSFTQDLGLRRVAGVGVVYSGAGAGTSVPPAFAHFVTNFPALHSVLIFVSFKPLAIPRVPPEQRFLVARLGPPEHRLFCCVVWYGYKDSRSDSHAFEELLILKLAEFLRQEAAAAATTGGSAEKTVAAPLAAVEELMEAKEAGVAYLMGHTRVYARRSSPLLKKLAIDVFYGFLRRNCRRPADELGISPSSLIEIGMVYYV
ncbi:unnamed protein product [Spirodela intermedia]|uniref:Potassium transporter n=1 Tax=Spirodela intermedia TaxID=51605 RepID=A0A7I8IJW5_SPIIN|nr:unnamed protein product [Spirodela intermedia]CAA6658040.1 unnamed protein product [Spirodela intermedia]